jgi:type III pantothenate kinase
MFGAIGETKYIIERVKNEVLPEIKVIATGGLSNVMKKYADFDVCDPDLTLKGLAVLYGKNTKGCK